MKDPKVNPVPLGKIAVAAAGTPVALNSNCNSFYGDTYSGHGDNGLNLWFHRIWIDSDAGNTGYLYYGVAGMNKTTGAGVIKRLSPAESWELVDPLGRDIWQVGDYVFDADTNANFGFATVQRS